MGDTIYPTESRQKRMAALTNGGGTFEIAGDITSASAAVTNVPAPDYAKVVVGDEIWGMLGGAGADNPVVSKTPPSTITATTVANATAAGINLLVQNASWSAFIGLQGQVIHAYTTAIDPTEATTLAELEAAEAVVAGFTPPAGDWTVDAITPSGQAMAESQLVIVAPSGPLSPAVQIGGFWVDDGTDPIAIWPLDNAVTLTGVSTPLKVMLTDAYPTPGEVIQVFP